MEPAATTFIGAAGAIATDVASNRESLGWPLRTPAGRMSRHSASNAAREPECNQACKVRGDPAQSRFNKPQASRPPGQYSLAVNDVDIDDEGNVVRDLRGGFIELQTGLLENPYLHVSAPELSLLAEDGEVVLSARTRAGLGEGCFTDSRLVAVMDVRHLEKDGLAPCARLQSLTGESCVLCDEGDKEAGCFLLAVDGLGSVASTDSTVVTTPRPRP